MTLAKNKKAFFDYEIVDQYEAGIMLKGYEVKAIRNGQVNLKGSYVLVAEDAAYVSGMHIGQYESANVADYDPTARRKLLLNRSELNKLVRAESEAGLTIVPLEMYLKKGLIKLKIAVVKGKKTRDKRQTIKRREDDRRIGRIMKNFK